MCPLLRLADGSWSTHILRPDLRLNCGFLGRCLARSRRSDRLIVSGLPSSARTSIGASEVISVRSCVRVPQELPARSLMVVRSLVAETAVSCGSCV